MSRTTNLWMMKVRLTEPARMDSEALTRRRLGVKAVIGTFH